MNPEMQGASTEALWMIEASAGTGKTYRLVGEVLLAVLRGIELRQVLVVTFTNKATAELSQRLQSKLIELQAALAAPAVGNPGPPEVLSREAAFKKALQIDGLRFDEAMVPVWTDRVMAAMGSLESASVMTIHSFCQRMLTRFGAELGRPESLQMVPDAAAARREIVENAFGSWLYGAANWDDGDLGRATGDFLTEIAGLDVAHAADLMERSVAYPNALVVSDWTDGNGAPVPLELGPDEALVRFREAVIEGGRLLAEQREVAAALGLLLQEIDVWDAALASKSGSVVPLSPDARYLRLLFSRPKNQKQHRAPETAEVLKKQRSKPVDAVVRWLSGTDLSSFPSEISELVLPNATEPKTAAEFAEAVAETVSSANVDLVESYLRRLFDATELRTLVNRARTCWLRASGALWRARLQREGWLTYDAMLSELETALHSPEMGDRLRAAIRAEFQVCLVDEFQDTDDIQWRALRRLFCEPPNWGEKVVVEAGRHFVLVGDPKQSIYRFRGSDLAVYREARKIADDNQMLSSLTASFRTSEPLVHALNVMFSKYNYNNDLPQWPFLNKDIEAPVIQSLATKQDATAALEFVVVPSENKNATASRVAARIARDRVERSGLDQAVLVRSHRDGALIEEELANLQIRSRRRELPLMMTEEASTVMTWLNFLAKPEVERFRRALALTPWLGWPVEDLALVVRDGGSDWASWLEQLDESRRVFQQQGVMAGFERLMQRRSGWDYIASGWHGEVQSDRLRQVLTAIESRAALFGASPAELARWMSDERSKEDDSEFKVRAAAKEKELRHEAVDIWTVHAAKGLEASFVYLPFLGRSADPDAKLCKNTYIFGFEHDAQERRWLDTRLFLKGAKLKEGADPNPTVQTDEHGSNLFAKRRALLEVEMEQARLGYVAMTRARHRVVTWWLEDDVGANGMLAGIVVRQSPTLRREQKRVQQELKEATARAKQVEESLAKLGGELTEKDLAEAQAKIATATSNPHRLTSEFWIGIKPHKYSIAESPTAPGTPKPLGPAEFVLQKWAKLAEDGSDKLQGRITVHRDEDPWHAAAAKLRRELAAAPVSGDAAEAALVQARRELAQTWKVAADRAYAVASTKRSFTSLSQQLKNKGKSQAASQADVGEAVAERSDDEADSGTFSRDERWDGLAGKAFGNLVHSFYEELDFESERSVDDEFDALELLRRHASLHARGKLASFETGSGWGLTLRDYLLGVLAVPLAGGEAGAGCSLSEVTLDTRADESSFDMRMCDTSSAAAEILKDFEGPEEWRRYFERLSNGLWDEKGILTGKMDLVFARPRADGSKRWFIADYKTNLVDPIRSAEGQYAQYGAHRLFEPMSKSDYLLQLLIYTVAWHRHLEQTLGDDYDYDRDFGGVYYLYIRGMEQGSDRGQFFFKPPLAWVQKLSEAWGKRQPSASGEAAE
jgi:ATP-dependent exoDNAse (exonuclease V) beta subunit